MEYIQPIIGFFALLLLGAVVSENIKAINLKYIVFGILIQLALAIVLIKAPFVSSFFEFKYTSSIKRE